MTRRLLWMMLAAGLLAVTATAARAQSPKAAGCPACSKECCKDCCPACAKDCGKESCKGCCMECWGEESCPAGCCPGCCGGAQATCKSPKNVMIFRIGAQPWNGPIPPWMPTLPPLPTPIAPLPPPWPASAEMMPPPMPMPPMPVDREYLLHMPREPRNYSVELKTIEGKDDQNEAVTMCPRLMVPEGHGCMVSFDDHEAVLGKCVACCPKMRPAGHSGGVVQVQVVGENDGKIDLDLNVQQTEMEKSGKDGVQVLTHSLHAVRTVPLGKATRLVLERTGGTPTRWLEVTVCPGEAAPVPTRTACTNAPYCPVCCTPEGLPPPHEECCAEGPLGPVDVVLDVVGEVISQLALCFFPYAEEQEAGCVLPDGRYVNHPPMYMPPCPAFPAQERVAVDSVKAPCACMPVGTYGPPCPPMSGACPRFAPAMPYASAVGAPIQICAATTAPRTPPAIRVKACEGESRLEITCGGGVQMACKKMDLKLANSPWSLAVGGGQVRLKAPLVNARANEFTTDQKDVVILKGKVRLSYTTDGECAEIRADRVEINFTDGTLKIKP
jgi:hypothetical protein